MAKSQSARNVFRGLLHTREPEVGMQVGIRDEEMDVSVTHAGWEPGGVGEERGSHWQFRYLRSTDHPSGSTRRDGWHDLISP